MTNFKGKIPILGVCYGAQYLAHFNGGKVVSSNKREYGRAKLSFIDCNSELFHGIDAETQVWMSHSDTVEHLPNGAKLIASTTDVENAAFEIEENWFSVFNFILKFTHNKGKDLLRNLIKISKIKANWTAESHAAKTISYIKETVKNEKIILGLSVELTRL